MLAPTTTNAVLGQDFYDAAGRRWVCKGMVTFQEVDDIDELVRKSVEANEGNRMASPPRASRYREFTVDELAEALRPVRLVGDYEYQLAEPDRLAAERAVAMRTSGVTPSTASHLSQEVELGTRPQHIIGGDDRVQTGDTHVFTGSASGHVQQGCTLAMIGPSTALSAAHCFYFNGAWINGGLVALGTNSASDTTYFGTFYGDLTLPGNWFSQGGAAGGAGTWDDHPGWDWDFAVIEFSPTRYPGTGVGMPSGHATGWYGTALHYPGQHYIMGYPDDKPFRTQWWAPGSYFYQDGARYYQSIDIWNGQSGACSRTLNTYWYCTGIQSSHWNNGGGFLWNEVRAWDYTTHNFFDAYGNWP